MTARLKNLSSTVLVVLSILDCFGTEGAYLDEVCEEYEALGLEVGKRSICTYMNRVAKLNYLKTAKDRDGSGRTIYKITKAGREELKWWRALVNSAA